MHNPRNDAFNGRTRSAENAASEQTLRIDARSNRTTYVYDDAGRLTNRRYPDGSSVTFAYDAIVQRTEMHDRNGRTTYTHDDVGRLKTVTNPADKLITYVYDAIGQRRYMQEPEGGRFTTVYDDAGQIRYLINPQNQRTTFSHDNAGRRTVERLANGARASYSYDDANQTLRLANVRSDSTTISSFDYKYDPVGNRTRVIESFGIRVTWSYDNKYQLTRERRDGANAYDITYSYDPAGNRKTKLEDAVRTTYVYDSANQIKYTEDNTGRTTYTFDPNGNQQIVRAPDASRTTYTWDYENRLAKVVLPTGIRNTMAYDANGKRVKKEDSTGTTKFVWDEEGILLETSGSETTQAVYTSEPTVISGPLSQFRGATTSYFHLQALGSVDRLTNASASVTDSYHFTTFGSAVASSGTTTNPFRYGSEFGWYRDADSSTFSLVGSNFNPAVGRFLSQHRFGYSPYLQQTGQSRVGDLQGGSWQGRGLSAKPCKKTKCSGFIIGALQFCADFCTGDWHVVGWACAGFGCEGPFGAWYGYLLCTPEKEFTGGNQPLLKWLPCGVCAPCCPVGGIVGLPGVFKGGKVKILDLECGVLTHGQKGCHLDVEIICLLNLLPLLGGPIAKIIEKVGKLLCAEVKAGIAGSFTFSLCWGIGGGIVMESAKGCLGGYFELGWPPDPKHLPPHR